MKLFVNTIAFTIVSLLLPLISSAQCSTCAAAVESSLGAGSTAAKGLNTGILYLIAMPFIMAIIFLLLYKKRKKYLAKFKE